jgi:hypothetical protein
MHTFKLRVEAIKGQLIWTWNWDLLRVTPRVSAYSGRNLARVVQYDMSLHAYKAMIPYVHRIANIDNNEKNSKDSLVGLKSSGRVGGKNNSPLAVTSIDRLSYTIN